MTMYKKINPTISFIEFIKLVGPVAFFNSLEGAEYVVQNLKEHTMHFIRKSSGEKWSMDLKEVYRAYIELTDFRTENFRPYVPLTHSPALGLLLYLDLLKK